MGKITHQARIAFINKKRFINISTTLRIHHFRNAYTFKFFSTVKIRWTEFKVRDSGI